MRMGRAAFWMIRGSLASGRHPLLVSCREHRGFWSSGSCGRCCANPHHPPGLYAWLFCSESFVSPSTCQSDATLSSLGYCGTSSNRETMRETATPADVTGRHSRRDGTASSLASVPDPSGRDLDIGSISLACVTAGAVICAAAPGRGMGPYCDLWAHFNALVMLVLASVQCG
ncbi:hypothetical protein HPB50_013760 [Hyalomma asiaticum]|uniref:Uncharacterized protein n=1 Tax=Hyalomma asiaticum TaxID=266040 RepID=A0ACB7TKF6_HYAAI|nr:hypothetical protein HPB50_013760 [Hyalomma asiaticum]